jgi:hypothetical protein
VSGEHTHALPAHEHDLPEHTHPAPAYIPARSHILLAAPDSRNPHAADHLCTGTNDHDALNNAVADLAQQGGKVELAAGTYAWDGEGIVNRDNVWVDGHGRGTVLVPGRDFPADGYMLRFNLDENRPLFGCKMSNLRLSGEGVKCRNQQHGILWTVQRGKMRDVTVYQMSGDGLAARNAGDNARGNVFSGLDIGGNGRYGLNLNLPDSHLDDCVVRADVEANVFGIMTGCMISNSHFFGSAAENQAKQQTKRNVYLRMGARNRMTGGKIEWAEQELVWLEGNPRGGGWSFSNVGFEGGSGAGDGLHPQLRVSRTGGAFWLLNLTGCQFGSEARTCSWNVEIEEGAVRRSRATGCTFAQNTQGDVTPVTGLTVL